MTTTSTTLLKAIGADLDSPRWTEFVARYQPVMESFLAQQFPSVDADDVMQETLIVIARVLPNYHYAPDTKGHFRNYLLGILKNKAREELKRRGRAAKADEAAKEFVAISPKASPQDCDDEDWRIAAAIIAVFVIVLQRRTRSMPKEIDIPPSPPDVEKSSSMRGAHTKLGDIISYDKGYKRINELPADASADQIIEAAIADAKDAYARQVEKMEKAKQQPNIRVVHNLILLPAVHGCYVNTFLRERGFNTDMRKKYQPVIDGLCRQYRREWEAHRCGMPYFVVIKPKTERRPKSLLDDSSFEVERIH